MLTRGPDAYIKATALSIARRFIGLREVEGSGSHPLILAMLQAHGPWIKDDATAWCGAAMAHVAWLLELPIPEKPLRARSWLTVGQWIQLEQAVPGFDIVIFSRGVGPQPGPEELDAPGHVALYAGRDDLGYVRVVGGNQDNAFSDAAYPASRVLGVRRL